MGRRTESASWLKAHRGIFYNTLQLQFLIDDGPGILQVNEHGFVDVATIIPGGGDMLSSVYDTDADGTVNSADFATAAAAINTTPGANKVWGSNGSGAQTWLTIGSGSGQVAAGDHAHAAYLAIANIDDTPVDGELLAPISSNWAYDHLAASNPHNIGASDITAAVPSGKFLRDDGTWQSPAGTGDMAKATYDPTNKSADAFDMDNMTQGDTNLFVSSSEKSTWNGKQNALTFGIANTNSVVINAADVADNDYAKFTASGLEGRSYAEVLSDIGAAPSSHNHDSLYAQVSYNPVTMTVNYGTLDTGVVGDLAAVGGTDVNISEVTGANPLQVTFDFTSVMRMTTFGFLGYYAGGAGHQIYIEIYNVSTANWDLLGVLGTEAVKGWYSYALHNVASYMNAGAVSVRMRHTGTGINTHDLILDYVELNYGGAGGQTNLTASEINFVAAGDIAATNVQNAITELDSEKVAKAAYDANTILAANTDNTPAAVTITEQTILGRLTGENIKALSIAETKTLLGAGSASGLATLDGSSKVVQNPADATATATASKIPIADGSGYLNTWIQAASDSVSGKVELATASETTTGTDAARAVTPDGLAGSDFGKRTAVIQIFDHSTDATTGDGKTYFNVPAIMNGHNLVGVRLLCSTASSSGTPTVQIYNITDSHDLLTTRVTIDANEYSSTDATTAPVIDTTYDDLATNDRLRFDVDVAGTGCKGLTIELTTQLP